MADSETLTSNARVKAGTTYAFNLSAALIGATAARVWIFGQFDLTSLTWGIVAAALFAIAYGYLYLLEPEADS